MRKMSKTKRDKTKSRLMSGGWWCAAVVIRAIERQNKTKRENEMEQKTDINNIETINGSVFTSAKQKSG